MSNATAAYTIEFAGFSPTSADTNGYNANDYLHGFADQEFSSEANAQAWIDANLLGADCNGVSAHFEVMP